MLINFREKVKGGERERVGEKISQLPPVCTYIRDQPEIFQRYGMTHQLSNTSHGRILHFFMSHNINISPNISYL